MPEPSHVVERSCLGMTANIQFDSEAFRQLWNHPIGIGKLGGAAINVESFPLRAIHAAVGPVSGLKHGGVNLISSVGQRMGGGQTGSTSPNHDDLCILTGH